MPHVSKQLLEKGKFVDIHKQLFKVVGELSRSGKAKAILNQLLTKTEKLMLAKRLAIIFMLDQKNQPMPFPIFLKSANQQRGECHFCMKTEHTPIL